jgi:hypothetical protein
MSSVGQREKRTQQRVVTLFREQLGYDYLGDWTDRATTTSKRNICGRSCATNRATMRR